MSLLINIRSKIRERFLKIRSSSSGVAALEASLTLPVLLSLVFFIIEMLRIQTVRIAMDTIAMEATLDFTRNRNTSTFSSIIKAHLPAGISESKIKYYFSIYNNLETMCAAAPYGNEEVYLPAASSSQNFFVDHDRDEKYWAKETEKSENIKLDNLENPSETAEIKTPGKISGRIFVLTFVCDYSFSSAYIQKLYAGGSNTKMVNVAFLKNLKELEEKTKQIFSVSPKIMIGLKTAARFLGGAEEARADEEIEPKSLEDYQKEMEELNNKIVSLKANALFNNKITSDELNETLKKIDECKEQLDTLYNDVQDVSGYFTVMNRPSVDAVTKIMPIHSAANSNIEDAKEILNGKYNKETLVTMGLLAAVEESDEKFKEIQTAWQIAEVESTEKQVTKCEKTLGTELKDKILEAFSSLKKFLQGDTSISAADLKALFSGYIEQISTKAKEGFEKHELFVTDIMILNKIVHLMETPFKGINILEKNAADMAYETIQSIQDTLESIERKDDTNNSTENNTSSNGESDDANKSAEDALKAALEALEKAASTATNQDILSKIDELKEQINKQLEKIDEKALKNTALDSSGKGTKFLIYGRGVGVVN